MDCFINLPKMRDKKRGQISTEYLIVIGFITFVIITLMGVAFYYVGNIKDAIKENQLEGFANKLISSAETVYYAGNPSQVTVRSYLPAGVTSIVIPDPSSGLNANYQIVFTYTTNSGTNVRSFPSKVPLIKTGSDPTDSYIPPSEGVSKIKVYVNGNVTIQSVH